MDEKLKRITIRFPYSLWVSLRRAQEDGKIDSIQGEVIKVLNQKFKSVGKGK